MFLVHLFHLGLTWSSKNLNPCLTKVWFPKQQVASPESIRNTELQAPSENYLIRIYILTRSSGKFLCTLKLENKALSNFHTNLFQHYWGAGWKSSIISIQIKQTIQKYLVIQLQQINFHSTGPCQEGSRTTVSRHPEACWAG